jgi:hypothetical protein
MVILPYDHTLVYTEALEVLIVQSLKSTCYTNSDPSSMKLQNFFGRITDLMTSTYKLFLMLICLLKRRYGFRFF